MSTAVAAYPAAHCFAEYRLVGGLWEAVVGAAEAAARVDCPLVGERAFG